VLRGLGWNPGIDSPYFAALHRGALRRATRQPGENAGTAVPFLAYFQEAYPLAILPMVFYHVGQLILDTFIAERLRHDAT
jgi:hypothetical protein